MGASAVSVKIEPELRERVKRLAAKRQRTPQSLMRDAIREYVEREEAHEAREAFWRDADEAWRESRETGLHADSAEVLAWLATWGEETKLPPPACRQ